MNFPDNDLYIHRGCSGSVFVGAYATYDTMRTFLGKRNWTEGWGENIDSW